MKVTMIIPTLVQGGAEKQMSLLATGLPKSEFAVSVIALTAAGPWQSYLQDHGIEVTVIGKRFKADPLALGRLIRVLRAQRPDIVHTWIFAANVYGRLASRWAGVRGVVVGERCVELWKTEFHFWIDRRLDRRTQAFVTNSRGVVEFYQQRRIGLGKFHVIPNGLPIVGRRDPSARGQWRRRLELPEDALLVASVARLWPQKRLKDLIWAIDLLNCKIDRVHLVVAGEGPEEARLRQFAHEARVADRVHFVGHLADASSLLQASDLFCLVSEYEGQSNALMEAMQWGVPAVVSDITGNRDLIPDPAYGFLCSVGDRIGLARQMALALEDPVEAAQRAARAAERLQQQFSLSEMLQQYADLYRQVGAK
jgi:glycosyltransferase involved in cell wall biosynthesis